MAATATVRISEATHRTLRELSERERQPMQYVLDRAIEDYRRRSFLEAVNESFAKVNARKATSKRDDHDEWETTTNDGLTDE